MSKVVWDRKLSGDFSADFDCYIAEALLSEGRTVKGYEEALKKYNVTNIEDLAEKQKEKLHEYPKLEKLFYDIEMPLTKVLWKMEQTGILLDTQKLKKVGEEIDNMIAGLQKEISKQTGDDLNLNSSVQLGHFLAEKIGIPLAKTKTGRYATNEGELSKFQDQFPIITQLLKYRELTKLRSTYIESLIDKGDEQGRVHTTYHQTYINTGRIASSNPNLQNIPVTSEAGLKIKSCFIAPPGYSLVSFDYSQQELRILAHLTEEPALIQAFAKNLDVHTLTASRLFHVSYAEVTKQQRSVGKTINFGIIYGMSSFGMSESLHIPQEDAETFIKKFYAAYPRIKIFYDNYLKEARVNRVAETMLGRRRYVFEHPKQYTIDNGTRRVLMNYPIQGTAAELMKKAMVDIDKELLQKYADVSLLLSIHDDLVFQIPDTDKKKLADIISKIRDILCSTYPLSVPTLVDVKIGKEWGSMEKFAE